MPVSILKGTMRDGGIVYYTGKAGETAISRHKAYARPFTKSGPSSDAQRLVDAMNKGGKTHGINWEIVGKDD